MIESSGGPGNRGELAKGRAMGNLVPPHGGGALMALLVPEGERAAELRQKLQIEVQAKLDAAGKKILDDYQAARDRESAFLPAIIKGSVESMKLQAKRDWEKRNPVAIWAEKNNKVGLKNNAELKQINQNLKALKPSAGGSGSGGGGGGGIQVNEVSF